MCIDKEMFIEEAEAIEACYGEFGIEIRIEEVKVYENGKRRAYQVKTIGKTRIGDVRRSATDVQARMRMGFFATFMDNGSLCIALAKDASMDNSLARMIRSREFLSSDKMIPLAIAYDFTGGMYFADLVELTHMLIGGATKTGKTVALRCLILSIILGQSPDNVNLLMIDSVTGNLAAFDGIPFLSHRLIRDTQTALYAIRDLHREMTRRGTLSPADLSQLPYIVLIWDEFISFVLWRP